VFGEADGTFAEYVVAAADRLARVPDGLAFLEAAALPLAATTALACLRAASPSPAGRLLINGASGGVGTYAVQLAKVMRLEVTAVCSARNADLVRSLGADIIVDYRREDICASTERYDVVLDLVGNRPVHRLRALVQPSGTLVLSGGGVPGTGRVVGPLGLLVRAQFSARLPGPRIAVPQATPTRDGLAELAALVTSGRLKPVTDRVFGLEEVAAAIDYMETQHARAKVIITVSHQPQGPHER
jgi:NADPH:quinone reductase-like Zn-dependent oxidoreductase